MCNSIKSLRLIAVLAVLLGGLYSSSADAATITYVDSDNGYGSYGTGTNPRIPWRNSTFSKPLDLDGDNIYGSAGYIFYGVDTNTSSTSLAQKKGVKPTNPLTFETSYTSGEITDTIKTMSSLPTGVSLSNINQNRVDTYNLTHADNADNSGGWILGMASYDGAERGTMVDMLEFTFTEEYTQLRIGIVTKTAGNNPNGVGALQLSSGAQIVGATIASSPSTAGAIFYFFDLYDVSAGDTVTLSMARSLSGTAAAKNLGYHGITFDVIPEPSTYALLILSVAGMALGRRKLI